MISLRGFRPGRPGIAAPALQRGPAPACSEWPSTLRNMGEDGHGGKRFGAGAQAAEWDARYSERAGAIWSGRPNGRLVAEVAGLALGRALDVGCGEGADAVWLARSGVSDGMATAPASSD
jgi:hypothetical protein